MLDKDKINMYVFEVKDEWAAIRNKLFTGSRINEIMADGQREMTKAELIEYKKDNPRSKAKYTKDETVISDGAITYILELIQAMEGAPKPNYQSGSMDWGNQTEPAAAVRYCTIKGYDLNSNGVIYTSISETVFFEYENLLGCTPDLILPDRLAQIKCPDSSTHLYYKLYVNSGNFQKELPQYYDQIQLEMMLTQREVCDFFSYDPRFKREVMQTHTIEIKQDIERQNKIYRKAKLCKAKMEEIIKLLPA